MKKRKNEILRVQTLIEQDRLKVRDNFEELIINDVNSVLKEYFDFAGNPSFSITKNGDRLLVNISFLAINIKNFTVLPK